MADGDDRWLTAALAEYETLRIESSDARKQQTTVVQIGLSVAGVVASFGVHLQSGKSSLPSSVILMGVVPLLCALTLTIWLGELERMIRVGSYLRKVEVKINVALGANGDGDGDEALHWEQYLTEPGDGGTGNHNRGTRAGISANRLWDSYLAIGLTFACVAVFSVLLAVLHVPGRDVAGLILGLVFDVVALGLLVAAVLRAFVRIWNFAADAEAVSVESVLRALARRVLILARLLR